MEIIIPYVHYLAIMALTGSLISEHLILKPGLSRAQIKFLAGIDLVYGIAAALVLATGLLRWFVYGKGNDYYLSNPLFHIKLTIFVIIVILSIFPTLKFLKWKRQVKSGHDPMIDDKAIKRLLMFIRIELLLVAIIPLLAVMVARGAGN